DLIVYGATGYTGRLIAEYLTTSYLGDDAPSWAIAGRSTNKLQKIRADIGAPDDLPLVKADAAEPASLRSMCERAAVIITAVGSHPPIRPEHERLAGAVPNGADQHQERAPHEFPVGSSLRQGLRLRRDDGRAGIWGNRSRVERDVRHGGFLVQDRRSQTWRRPDSGRAREGLLRHPLPA